MTVNNEIGVRQPVEEIGNHNYSSLKLINNILISHLNFGYIFSLIEKKYIYYTFMNITQLLLTYDCLQGLTFKFLSGETTCFTWIQYLKFY